MGNSPSNFPSDEPEDIWWTNGSENRIVKVEDRSEKTENFIEEFDRKREKRKRILEEKRQEIQDLRKELVLLREENERLRANSKNPTEKDNNNLIIFLKKQNENLKEQIALMKDREEQREKLMEKNRQLIISISEMQSELQHLNTSVLEFERQKQDYDRHVVALKDVIKVSKELLLIRENEMKQLKEKLQAIEIAFHEKEATLMSNDLRKEYERQLANIRTLRELYEERSRTYKRETELLKSTIDEKNKIVDNHAGKISELEERVQQLENENSEKYDSVKLLESNLGLAKAECRQYQAELSVINQLFSHILLDFNNSPDLDFDKLLKQLEDHRDLLKDITTNEVSSEVSSVLPKVLLDLVNKISNDGDSDCDGCKLPMVSEETETMATRNLNSAEEIAENLPKVWKVLIELLGHQSVSSSDQIEDDDDENRCYKTVATPKGPSLVLSVSKTFFRLKELIIEKKMLERDMTNLKQLNSHLENRLQDQEKRFEVVSSKLSTTWNFVYKLQKEHRLLHTQEQILRYELAQKRKLLKELKQELEDSREKSQQAREKNSKTEREWLLLRKEFAARKKTITEMSINEDGNNSVESGYSDEREGSSDEEPGYETDVSECNLKVEEIEKKNDLSTTCVFDVIQDEMTTITSELTADASSSDPHNNQSEDVENKSSEVMKGNQTLEERLAARDERLKRLEGQCEALVTKVTNTSNKSVAICNKLDDLHEIYGESSSNGARTEDTEENNED